MNLVLSYKGGESFMSAVGLASEYARGLFRANRLAETAVAVYGAGVAVLEYFRIGAGELVSKTTSLALRSGLFALVLVSQYFLVKRMTGFTSLRNVLFSKQFFYMTGVNFQTAFNFAAEHLNSASNLPYGFYSTVLLLLQSKNFEDLCNTLHLPSYILIIYKTCLLFWGFFMGDRCSPAVASFILLVVALLSCLERLVFVARHRTKTSREAWVSFFAALISTSIVLYIMISSGYNLELPREYLSSLFVHR
jgi:hypothetical protein